MPVQAYAPDPNRLAAAPEAAELWRQILRDAPLDERFLEEATTAAEGQESTDRERDDSDIPDEQPQSAPGSFLEPVAFTTDVRAGVDAEQYGLCED